MLNCARHGHSPSVRASEGRPPILAKVTKTFSFLELKLNMSASEAYLNVKLWAAWRLAPGKGGSGGVLVFWQWTQKRFFISNYQADSEQIWHELSGNEAFSDYALHLDPPL